MLICTVVGKATSIKPVDDHPGGATVKFHVWTKPRGFDCTIGVLVEVRGRRGEDLSDIMREGDHVTCIGGVIGIQCDNNALHMIARDVVLQEEGEE